MLELVRLPCFIDLCLRLLELDAFLDFEIGNPLQILRSIRLSVDWLEAAEMLAVMDHHSNQGDKGDPDLDAERFLLLTVIRFLTVSVEGLVVEHLKLLQELVDTFLGLFALGHL